MLLARKLTFAALVTAQTSLAAPATPFPSTPGTPQLPSYLQAEELPNSLLLVPPPPAPESPAFALDYAMSQKVLSLQNSVAWGQAIVDANLKFPQAAGAFSCALGLPINEDISPSLVRMLSKMVPDAGRATALAKHHYKRSRPFMANGQAICTPAEMDYFLRDGSYPSGHSSIGMAWALALAEIAPDKTDVLMARGISLGLNRVVCNLHWLSDTREGRYLGAYTVARLHANSEFQADLALAKKEVQALRQAGLKPDRDCQAEEAAIAMQQTLLKEVLQGSLSQEGTH